MRTLNSTFISEKNKQENRPLHLYTIHNYNGLGNNLTYTDSDDDITFAGVTYTKFPISFDVVTENNKGAIDVVNVTVANISRLIQAYLEQYDFTGKKVTIRTVWANQLADTSAYIDDIFYIDSWTADEKNAVFSLSSKFDVLSVDLPLRRFSRNHCQWVYKGTECAAVSAESTCNKTKSDCKVRNNYSRFGAFPSIQPNKVIVA